MPRFRRKATDEHGGIRRGRSQRERARLVGHGSRPTHLWLRCGRRGAREPATATPAGDDFEPWTFDDGFATEDADFTTKAEDAVGYGVPDGPDGPFDSFEPRDLAESLRRGSRVPHSRPRARRHLGRGRPAPTARSPSASTPTDSSTPTTPTAPRARSRCGRPTPRTKNCASASVRTSPRRHSSAASGSARPTVRSLSAARLHLGRVVS